MYELGDTMAYIPTEYDVGLPKNLTYSDIYKKNTVNHIFAMNFPYDVVLALNPSDKGFSYPARSYIRGVDGSARWAPFYSFIWNSTANNWKPYNSIGSTYQRYWVEERFAGTQQRYIVCYPAASLRDGVTATGYIVNFNGGQEIYTSSITFRYDTGLPGVTVAGVWRMSSWAKTYNYDILAFEESGYMVDVFLPYVRDTLAVGTTATGYVFASKLGVYPPRDSWYAGSLGSLGKTWVCTQVEPEHKWKLQG